MTTPADTITDDQIRELLRGEPDWQTAVRSDAHDALSDREPFRTWARGRLTKIYRASKAPRHLERLSCDLDNIRGRLESRAQVATEDGPPPHEVASFARTPVATPLMTPRAGALLVLAVDLAPPLSAAPVERIVSGLPEDWQSLPVVARVTCVGANFEEGCAEGVVLVRRDAPSIPCRLVGTIDPEAKHLELAITFYERGRYCGELRISLALGRPPEAAARCPARPHNKHGGDICDGTCCTACGGPLNEDEECQC